MLLLAPHIPQVISSLLRDLCRQSSISHNHPLADHIQGLQQTDGREMEESEYLRNIQTARTPSEIRCRSGHISCMLLAQYLLCNPLIIMIIINLVCRNQYTHARGSNGEKG